MKISTKGRYGTRALLELAMRDTNEPMLLRNIAKKQDISLAYLEHVISPLIAGGILRSTKGPKGGISLNKKPSEIKLSEVIRLLEGSVALDIKFLPEPLVGSLEVVVPSHRRKDLE